MPKQKSPGEGTIYDLPNGLYRGEIMLGYRADGKRNRFRCTGETKDEVRRKLRKAKQDYDDGNVVVNLRRTVGEYLQGWLEDTAKPTVFARTYVGYKSLIERHALPAFGKVRLERFAGPYIQRLIADMSQQLAPATVRHLYACLHAAFQHGVDMRTLPYNYCDGVKLPQPSQRTSVSLSKEQGISFYQVAKDDTDYGAFFTLALTTGMREGELYALKWEDIDLAKAKATIRRAFSRVHGIGRIEKGTKTGRERIIPLPAVTIEQLRLHWKRQQDLRRKAGIRWQESGLVFTSNVGTPVSERTVVRRFQALLALAKLPRIRLYDLRHSAASIYLSLGIGVKDLQVILGHATAKMTLDVYGHSFDEARSEAAKRFSEMLTAED